MIAVCPQVDSRLVTRSTNGLVADDSSAQPLNRTDRGIVNSPSRLLAAVPRFLMVANTTGSGRPQIPAGHPIRLVRKDTLRCSNGASGRRADNMPSPEKDRLAAEAMQCWADFQEGLSSDKQKYPVQQFRAFWAVTKRLRRIADSSSHTSSAFRSGNVLGARRRNSPLPNQGRIACIESSESTTKILIFEAQSSLFTSTSNKSRTPANLLHPRGKSVIVLNREPATQSGIPGQLPANSASGRKSDGAAVDCG